MTWIARVNPRYFAACAVVMARGDFRYYLNGIYVERSEEGVVLVATDGHRMVAMHDPDGWMADGYKNFIVGGLTDRLLSACRRRPTLEDRGLPQPNLWIAENHATLSRLGPDDAETATPFGPDALFSDKTRLIDGKYPDWRSPLPTEEQLSQPAEFPEMNSRYVAALLDVAKALVLSPANELHRIPLSFFPTGSERVVIARFTSGDLANRFIGVLMPMRGCGFNGEPIPGWAKRGAARASA